MLGPHIFGEPVVHIDADKLRMNGCCGWRLATGALNKDIFSISDLSLGSMA